MPASVLFDAPGPVTRARHRVYAVVSVVALLGFLAYAAWRLYEAGQFEYDLWEPFWTPKYVYALLAAWGATISIAVLAVLGALAFGFAFGIAKLSDHEWVRRPAWLAVEFFRAVPVIMLMVLFFYTAFNGLAIETGAYWTAVLGLTVYNGAVLAEVVRAGINAVPRGQSEAAYALGLRKGQVTNLILLPQAVKIMIPAIVSQMVVALKDTSLILIVVPIGLTKFAKQLPQEFNNLVPTVLVVAGCYILTNLVLTWVAHVLQRRFVGERDVLDVGMVGETAGDQSMTVVGPILASEVSR